MTDKIDMTTGAALGGAGMVGETRKISSQSTRAVGPGPFEPEDFAYTAKLLRDYVDGTPGGGIQWAFHAVCSNNLNIILAALDRMSEDEGEQI